MQRFGSFMIGALIGGFIGALTAVLLAPSSGEELRENIQARANQVRADVSKAAADRRAELERQLAALRSPQKPQQPT